MSEPVHPLRRASDARRPRRRASDADEPMVVDAESRRLPVPIDAPRAAEPPPSREQGAYAAYAAHLMGQSDQKRGLRGGPETLDAARSAYLGAEYSGPLDRRPRKGVVRKTEI